MSTRFQNFKFFLVLMSAVLFELSKVLLSVRTRLGIGAGANELGNLAPLASILDERMTESVVLAS
jgi:hypothetical protein